jgi:aryl-alcohol dehydrogenase-like predicted oxidoreductase
MMNPSPKITNPCQRLGIGTVQFGLEYGIANTSGQVPAIEAAKILDFARSNGTKTLDTAIGYGSSEATLGQIGVNHFDVVTKIPPYPDNIKNPQSWIQTQIEGSLHRLQLSSLHAVMFHRASDLLLPDGNKLHQALIDMREAGKIRKIGVSIYSPEDLDALWERYAFDIVQAPFNLIDRRLYNSGWLSRLKDQDVEIHTRSAFLQGLLLMPLEEIPAIFNRWSDVFAKWHHWLSDHNLSAIAACLNYPLSLSEIDRVIVGTDSLAQWQANTNAVQSYHHDQFPDINCDDSLLINPALWNTLNTV